MPRPKPEDVTPNGKELAIVSSEDINKGTNKPEGVWPEVWRGTSHKERNKLIKEAREFREQYETGNLAEAPLEGIRPTVTT